MRGKDWRGRGGGTRWERRGEGEGAGNKEREEGGVLWGEGAGWDGREGGRGLQGSGGGPDVRGEEWWDRRVIVERRGRKV